MLTLTSMQDPVNSVHLVYVRIKAFSDVILREGISRFQPESGGNILSSVTYVAFQC